MFRLFRGNNTDATTRNRYAPKAWLAGRTDFNQHRQEDVPQITFTQTASEPFHFTVDLSAALVHAEEYPMEFAFSNFLYWWTRKEDVIMVLQDREDLFGTTALYCNRRVIVTPVPAAEEDEVNAIDKAYTTMAYLLQDAMAFESYPQDAKFATMSRLVRNTRKSKIDGLRILESQTECLARRFKHMDMCTHGDLITPCTLVHTTPNTHSFPHTHTAIYL